MPSRRSAIRLAALLIVPFSLSILPTCALGQGAMSFKPKRFSVVVEGAANGPAVLLLPGVSSSRAVYDAEARKLAPRYRLYRVQIAGFAGEPAGPNASGPVLAPVVEELHHYIVANRLHPAVIGHSMGGLLALMLTTSHPEDVSKTMVVAALPFYGMMISPSETVEMLRPQAIKIHDQALRLTKTQFDSLQPGLASQLATSPDKRQIIADSSIATDRTVYVNAVQDDMMTDLRPQLASIKTPVTVVFPYLAAVDGEYEEKIANLYNDAYQSIPHLTMVKIDDSRHFIMYDQPAEFHTAVVNFLK
jgi:pimeloyl-ACP methyl ester carboxylesterase